MTNSGIAKPLAGSQHRYHHNVLAALDDPSNPLHEILATGDARRQLSRAKELRNRWKFADDPGEAARFVPAPLESYNLEQMLQTIFAAFDQAYLQTEQYMRTRNGQRQDGGPISTADWTTDSEDWGFIVDAMDWEAV